MFKSFKSFLKTTEEHKKYLALPKSKRNVVVYSEGSHDWPHLGPIIKAFLKNNPTEEVAYLSSGENDPGLNFKDARYSSFFIGSGTIRTVFFKSLDAKVLLLSLPDLENLELKKSVFPVEYLYAYHSINSTHIVYRDRAFEHYPNILCVGPHHLAELRKEEEIRKIKPRNLIPAGSVKLDTLIESYKDSFGKANSAQPTVLLAPSWGSCSFAEDPKLLEEMIQQCLAIEWKTYLRLHPMTLRHHPKFLDPLKKLFASALSNGQLIFEENLNENDSLKLAHVMVSDWSGAATEFSFALGKPVLFMNTPQKINNPRYQDFGMRGIEDFIREEIGQILNLSEVSRMGEILRSMYTQNAQLKDAVLAAREKWIYNIGRSAEVSAEQITKLLHK